MIFVLQNKDVMNFKNYLIFCDLILCLFMNGGFVYVDSNFQLSDFGL